MTIKGVSALLNQRVTFFCVNYIVTGNLTGITENEQTVCLDDFHIVYETGPFNEPNWSDAQKLPNHMYIQMSAVEFFGIVK